MRVTRALALEIVSVDRFTIRSGLQNVSCWSLSIDPCYCTECAKVWVRYEGSVVSWNKPESFGRLN